MVPYSMLIAVFLVSDYQEVVCDGKNKNRRYWYHRADPQRSHFVVSVVDGKITTSYYAFVVATIKGESR